MEEDPPETELGSCPTRLLADRPASEDLLGGAHERVAKAIVDLICAEDGGKAIGLEGSWGSGKSTILSFVARMLETRTAGNARAAVFDVWAHQGDPLRRTFLEKLIEHLDRFHWLADPEAWDQRREELAKRRREDHQQTFPRLSGRGAFFALSLLLVPVGVASVTLEGGPSPWSIVLALAPFLVSVVLAAEIAIRPSITGLPDRLWGKVCHIGRVLWNLVRLLWHPRALVRTMKEIAARIGRDFPSGLLSSQTITETKSITIETPDPTSVEFERTFRELLDEALTDSTHRLVIAVDNLDRVEAEDALSIWSTLQTFLQTGDHDQPQWLERLWILVSFDRGSISRLWRGNDADMQQDVARSFLDKTFQVQFRIPPPALSNWGEYLRERLREAFPKHGDEDHHGVYRAFALRKGHESARPTPRSLKLFVNEIGAVHRQWEDQFRLQDYACFVLLHESAEDAIEVALRATSKHPDPDHAPFARSVMGEKWRDTLAALHFNVPINEARQMLLRGPIETALAEGDGSALRERMEGYPDGFWAVFEYALPGGAPKWDDVEPLDLTQTARALVESGIQDFFASPRRHEVASVLAAMQEVAAHVAAWQPFHEEMATGLLALLEVTGTDSRFAKRLTQAITKTSVASDKESAQGAAESVSPDTWLAAAIRLLRGLNDRGASELIENGLEVPLTPAQWVECAAGLHRLDPDGQMVSELRLGAPEKVDELLAERVAPGQIAQTLIHAIAATLRTHAGESLDRTMSAVATCLASTDPLQPAETALLLSAIQSGRVAGLVDDATYRKLAESGALLHHLHHASASKHAKAMAACTFAYLQSVPDASKPAQQAGNSEAGHQKLVELLSRPDSIPALESAFKELIEQHGGASELVRMAEAGRKQEALLCRVLRSLLGSDPAVESPEFVREHWRTIWEAIEATNAEEESTAKVFDEVVLGQVASLDDLLEIAKSDEFDPDDAALYLALLRVADDARFAEWAGSGLASVGAERWVTALGNSEDHLVELIIELARRDVLLKLSTPFIDALVDYSKDNATAEDTVPLVEEVARLADLLEADERRVLAREVYEVLENSRGKAAASFFDLFDAIITDRELLLNEDRFPDRVCDALLEESNERGLQWLRDVLTAWPTLLDEHRESAAVKYFRDHVLQRLEALGGDPQALPAVQAIAETLGIAADEKATGAADEPGDDDG